MIFEKIIIEYCIVMKQNQPRPPAMPLKVILLGDYGVGKTALINSYIDGKFSSPPIKGDYRSKLVDIGEKQFDIQFWDTAGQQKYNNISKYYYRHASALILVYDLTNAESLESIPKWIEMFETYSNKKLPLEKFPMILVGNKMDLIQKRAVKIEQILEIKEKYPFLKNYEASSLTSQGIYEFLEVIYEWKGFVPLKKEKRQYTLIRPKDKRKYREYTKCC